METKLQELTTKIYKEGIEKAEQDANKILDDANNQSSKIIENAKKDAKNIIDNAKKESEQLKNKTLSELKMASNQALITLKQSVVDLLSANTLSDAVKSAGKDPDFIKDIIKELISKWNKEDKNLDLELILPEKMKKELIDFFKNQAKDILNKGVELKFDQRMDNGFKIGPKDNSFVLSFTDKDLEQFFQSFLKIKTKDILFIKG